MGRWSWVLAVVGGLAALGGRAAWVLGDLQGGGGFAPQLDSSYVGSRVCRDCHGAHYASWAQTFHSTMTREASDASVLAPFDGRSLSYLGVVARMERDGEGRFWMGFSAGEERWRAEVRRTVGSHRYQQYLAQDDDVWFRLPVAWDVEAGRFVHTNGLFLTPDPQRGAAGLVASADYNRHVARWNDNCIYCHNVAPNPGSDGQGHFASQVAELGVACEACHGPGAVHAQANRDPLRRYALHLGVAADPVIAGPSGLSPERSAEVCGRCHGQRLSADIERVHREGDRFVPGETLARYSRPLFRDTALGTEGAVFALRFWPSRTPRLTAYEYQGYLQSGCRLDGRFDCGSCHSMHDAPPALQVRAMNAGPDGLCTQCHRELGDRQAAAEHSRHVPSSAGSRCVSCHMPRLVYGLVRAHRSHRVGVPGQRAGEPDSCGLCHVAEGPEGLGSLWERAGWHRPMAVAEMSVLDLLLAGDPIERAVAADAVGRKEADDTGASTGLRVALLLDVLELDTYPAVRQIASRSLTMLLHRHGGPFGVELPPQLAMDEPAERKRQVGLLRDSLPAALRVKLDAQGNEQLRARAQAVAIEIGE